jgi:arginase family enzyme
MSGSNLALRIAEALKQRCTHQVMPSVALEAGLVIAAEAEGVSKRDRSSPAVSPRRALVADKDAIQIGERGLLNGVPQYYSDIADTNITRLYAPGVEAMGVEAAAARAVERLRAQGLDRAWLHLDLDILDGLDFAQMSALVGALVASGRFAGADVTIYDPDRDPQRAYARPIVEALGEAFGRLAARSPHARSAASHPRTGAVSR